MTNPQANRLFLTILIFKTQNCILGIIFLYVMFLGNCFSLKSSTRILSTSSQFVGRIWKIECMKGAGVVSLPFFSNPCFPYLKEG